MLCSFVSDFIALRDLVWWVSVWKSGYGEMRRNARERGSLCYFVMHRPDVVLPQVRFDCSRDIVWWVSVWKSGYGEMRRNKRRKRVTVLFRNASARCCAPTGPISLYRRCSVVSVCVKKWIWWNEEECKRKRVTVLFRNAAENENKLIYFVLS